MKILGFDINVSKSETIELLEETPQKSASFRDPYGRNSRSFSVASFDGEKNYGEAGPATHFILDHQMMTVRSWQLYLTSEIAQTVLDRYIIWLMGGGLKLNYEPNREILEPAGIDLSDESFKSMIEARFHNWAKSKNSSYNGEQSFNALSKEAVKNGLIGGDCLIVLSHDGVGVKVRIFDTAHLQTPPSLISRNIRHGIELNEDGSHKSYHIRVGANEFREIQARTSSGLRVAFLYYGHEYRTDNVRGIPIITTSTESISKLDRYKEAAVGGAEERQKIAYTINHQTGSDGKNPFDSLATARYQGANNTGAQGTVTADDQGNALANTVAATTGKMAFNMTQGASMEVLDSRQEMFFEAFYGTGANGVCASVGIPPNVAYSMYNNSFSASRAATKDFEHTMLVRREGIYDQMLSRVFDFWLYIEIQMNRVFIPGYTAAFISGDWVTREAITNSRFTGAMFPHIDPLKEANAERVKLGPAAAMFPLTSIEKSTRILDGGNAADNAERNMELLRMAEGMGMPIFQTDGTIEDESGDNGDEDQDDV